jgi:hypothetical protein
VLIIVKGFTPPEPTEPQIPKLKAEAKRILGLEINPLDPETSAIFFAFDRLAGSCLLEIVLEDKAALAKLIADALYCGCHVWPPDATKLIRRLIGDDALLAMLASYENWGITDCGLSPGTMWVGSPVGLAALGAAEGLIEGDKDKVQAMYHAMHLLVARPISDDN